MRQTRPAPSLLSMFLCTLLALGGCVPRQPNQVNNVAQPLEPVTWRSSLYPEDWTSAFTDSAGRFLHDFSYAGYHSGAVPLPDSHELPLFNVQNAPYHADASGQTNAAPAIQKAIDDARQAGGGIIFLPAGSYRLDFGPEQKAALIIKSSHIVLRGEGESTQLFTLEENMRDRSLVQIAAPQNRWTESNASASIPLIDDALGRATTVNLASLGDLKEGDAIILRSDVTPEFASELGMSGQWEGKVDGPHIYRRITAIDRDSQSIALDVPVRFPLRVRDHARIYKVAPPIEEIGVEQLSFGMKQLSIGGLEEDDFDKPGTAGYLSHRAFALRLAHVQNSWIRGVTSFQLAQNTKPVHLLSGGILLERTRFVTVADSRLALPLYKGAGGNGYLYEVANSQEILIRDSSGRGGRHNFDLKYMGTSGVVFLRCQAIDGALASDFHMHLSAAVLFDSTLVDGDLLEARYRDSGTVKHGQSATESVFWNTHGLRYSSKRKSIVLSQQWGQGYVIGTKGPAFEVETPVGLGTDPRDFVEGPGIGQNLEPQSLYEDQLQRRLQVFRNRSAVRYPTSSQEERQKAAEIFYDRVWKKSYLREGCGGIYVASAGGTGEHVGDTISEAHGYGMLILPLMAYHDPEAQRLFDGMMDFFLRFRNAHGLMNWTVDVEGSCQVPKDGDDSATDGDLDIAYGLLLADHVFGSTPTRDYVSLARELIQSIETHTMHAKTHLPLLGDWARDSDRYQSGTRPSDFMTGHFKAFQKASGSAFWGEAVDAVYTLVSDMQDRYAKDTGLLPDFVITQGPNSKPAPSHYLESMTDGEYGYNACRVPWRLAADFIMSGDQRALSALNKMNRWVRTQSGGNPEKILDGYKLSGGKGSQQAGPSMAFIAPFALAAMAGDDQIMLDAFWSALSRSSAEGYYEDSIRQLSLISLAGLWQQP